VRLTAQVDADRFARGMLAEAGRIARGMRAGMTAATNEVKATLRQQIQGGGLRGGRALATAWQSRVYPAAQNGTFRPAGLVYSKAPDIHSWLDRSTPVVARNRKWLAIPTSINQVTGRGGGLGVRVTPQQMTPGAGAFFIRRKNGPGLLWCLPVAGSGGGRGQGRARANVGGVAILTGRMKGRTARIRATLAQGWVPMFTLVPQVQPRKVLDVAGVRRQVPAIMARHISAALRTERA
jgi:hypothetical protein